MSTLDEPPLGMPVFELLGDAADEMRMLVHRATGYSIPIPGHPRMVEPARGVSAGRGRPAYGALVSMTDLPIELGFRMDTLPSAVEPQALAIALAASYAKHRSGRAVSIEPMIGTYLPRGASAGLAPCTAWPPTRRAPASRRRSSSRSRCARRRARFRLSR